MRYKVFITMTLFGLLTVPLASAQSSRPLRADIPFDFGVMDSVLPAGNYQLTYSHSNGTLLIRGLDQDTFAVAIPYSVQANQSQRSGQGLLVFHRLGSTYFLSQMFHGYGQSRGSQVRKSRSERDLIARIPGSHVERASITVPAK